MTQENWLTKLFRLVNAGFVNVSSLLTSIGTLADEESVESLCGRSYTLARHFHTRGRSYPFLGAGITLTGSSSANVLGAFVEIVPVLANEIDTLTINSACTENGFVTIDLDGIKHTVVVSVGTANEVATQLRGYTWNTCECGTWATSGEGANVIFTRPGVSTTGVLSNLGTTGVTGTFVKTQTGTGISKPFDIHVIQGGIANKKDTYNIVLYKGTLGYEERITNIRVSTEADNSAAGMLPTLTELLPAGTRVSAQLASGTGGSDTLVISLLYHVY